MRHRVAGRESRAAGDAVVQPEDVAEQWKASGVARTCSGTAEDVAVRATAVGRDTVLAGDPKGIRLLCNTTLITDIPSRGSKEERIRIHLQVWANIRNNGYKR